MLNMNCPSCGAGGRVPDHKINARLHCKKCLAVFHLTALGNPVMGPPPTPEDEREPVRRQVDYDDQVEALIDEIRELPRKLLKPALVVVLLFLAYGLYQFVLPTGLNTRATQAAMSLTSADPRGLQDLSLPGTGAATLAWYAGVRARNKDFLMGDAVAPKVEIMSVNSDLGRGLAEVTAVIREPEATSRSRLTVPDLSVNHGGERAVEVRIVLSGGGLKGWRVDGGRTLESFQRSVSSELVKNGKEEPAPRSRR